ncbi:unnamed protein product [Clavelina lepadiformis]|uniref:CCHC-type domain-containing protein n=1 Tax=Clavelina lepadiformis TaxID=159417 RepID=A0ABP0GM15_CLALP
MFRADGQEFTCKFCGEIGHKQAACPDKKEFPEFASSLNDPANLATELATSTSKNNPDVQSMMTSTNQSCQTPSGEPMGAASKLMVEALTNPNIEKK